MGSILPILPESPSYIWLRSGEGSSGTLLFSSKHIFPCASHLSSMWFIRVLLNLWSMSTFCKPVRISVPELYLPWHILNALKRPCCTSLLVSSMPTNRNLRNRNEYQYEETSCKLCHCHSSMPGTTQVQYCRLPRLETSSSRQTRIDWHVHMVAVLKDWVETRR